MSQRGYLMIIFVAFAIFIDAILYARKTKDEPEEENIQAHSDAWPPAPTSANSKP